MNFPVAIITGAGGGIGGATARELSSLGWQIVLCGRSAASLEATAKDVSASIVVPADLTRPDDADRVVSTALSHFGRVDALINSAGIAPALTIEQTTNEQWRAVIDTNLSAPFYLSRAVWPVFRRQGAGVIVNVSSLAARDPFPGFAAYGSAKAGLNLLGLSLAREGTTMGIRVCTVAPGAVETPLFRSLMTPEQFPATRTLEPVDVAKVISQCVAGDLKFTSGEVIWMHK